VVVPEDLVTVRVRRMGLRLLLVNLRELGVFGAGVLRPVVAAVFGGVPFPRLMGSTCAGVGRFIGRSGL
jgi:hypothetical protein